MSYKSAAGLLPTALLEELQQYVQGEALYIPRKPEEKRRWGAATATRAELAERNAQILRAARDGHSVGRLCEQFYLSPKSIQRILREARK